MARILVVDDEEQVRTLMKKVLSTDGHVVVEACNGLEAMRAYNAAGADLVITDILMPEKGGLALITELKRTNPDQQILAISGGGKDGKMDFLATAATVKGVRTLHKPFSIDNLSQLVQSILQGQEYSAY